MAPTERTLEEPQLESGSFQKAFGGHCWKKLEDFLRICFLLFLNVGCLRILWNFPKISKNFHDFPSRSKSDSIPPSATLSNEVSCDGRGMLVTSADERRSTVLRQLPTMKKRFFIFLASGHYVSFYKISSKKTV